MAVITKTVPFNKCEICKHEWQQRPKRLGRRRSPKVCPICKSRDWNLPRGIAAPKLTEAEGLR